MSDLRIVFVGDRDDAVLHRPAVRVRDFGPALHQLLDQMVVALRDASGVGLAAPQIGIGQRIAVIEYPEDEDRPEETKRIFELINPEIIKAKGSEIAQEGCLSIPGMAADVDRATQLIVRAQDRNGNEVRYKVYDWLARIFQHEIDHLHGVLMTDRAQAIYKLVKNAQGEIEAIPIDETIATPSGASPTASSE
jgi:peptide deformylase